MKISELLTPSLIKLDVQSTEKPELFAEMVQLFVNDGLITDGTAAVEALVERENKMSTGISRWLGLPHGKLAEANGLLMALGVSKRGLDYDSLDGEPVYIVITIFAELGNPGPHILALAEISRLFSIPGFAEKIRAATSARDILQIIKSEE